MLFQINSERREMAGIFTSKLLEKYRLQRSAEEVVGFQGDQERKKKVTKEKNEIGGKIWIAFNEEPPLKILG